MAQSGYTPISLYYSSTTTNVPLAANLTAGELAINTADGKLFYKDSSNVVQVIGTKGGVGSSSTTQVLYNSSGLVVGSANLTFDGTKLSTNTQGIANYGDYTGISTPSYSEGRLWYDSTSHALAYYNDASTAIVHIGQDIQIKVINNTGSSIPNGSPVYVTGTSSGQTYPNVALAKADVAGTAAVIGLTNGAIANGAIGYVTASGGIDNVNTGTFTVGQVLYLSPFSAGQLQNTIPATGLIVQVGLVIYVNSSTGKIYVKQTQPLNLATTQGGTGLTSYTAGDITYYASGTAFTKLGIGTVGQILTSSGTAPQWSTLTGVAVTTFSGGTTGLTPNTATSGAITLAGTLITSNGGTGLSSYTAGDTTYYASGTALTKLAIGAAGTIKTSTGTAPQWVANLTTAQGGTGLTSFTAGDLVYYATGTSFTKLGIGTSNYVMTSSGTAPQWSQNLSIGSLTASSDSTFSSTGALLISKGTTAQQPASPVTGMLRYNTTTNQFEGYSGSSAAWNPVGGASLSNDTSTASNLYPLFASATSGTATTLYTSNAKYLYKPSTGDLSAIAQVSSNGITINATTVGTNYTIQTGNNGFSVGPITVSSGITVTVSSGQKWVVI